MMLIVGLGNPGEKYRLTRHNVGFMVIDLLSGIAGTPVTRKACSSLVGEGFLDGLKVVLAKPQTFMNRSGQAVASLAAYYRAAPGEVLVICDDLDLPFGRLRLRAKGGSGGHRGLESIITALGSNEFPRLRVGIGRAGEAADYVLERFSSAEGTMLPEILDTAAQAAVSACREGLERSMNRFNRWQPEPGAGK